MLLEQINQPNDIKKIDPKDYDALAEEIRRFLVQRVAENGGHLASNLGAVELTMALHLSVDLPNDKIVFDVGHQAYTHKILTGRRDGFYHLREFGCMSGFPKARESECDVFDTGHSSNSISVALGLAAGRDLLGKEEKIVAVIGDGALTGGMAYEALNNASELKSNLVIVLNDNEMSISKNVGGLSRNLSALRTSENYRGLKAGVERSLESLPGGDRLVSSIRRTKDGIKQLIIPGMMFEEMGITYLGPVDGHDITTMMKIFREAFRVDGPVLVHVHTQKGRGYLPAELQPSRFHGIDKFDVETGDSLSKGPKKIKYTDVFSNAITRTAEKNDKIVAITAAMMDGTGLKRFEQTYPERFFDVGIAEAHGVTFAAGLAKQGLIPVFAVYSSFLQRGFDQVLEDVCLQNLHVILAIDRAGIVGNDGETHHGMFDISYLSMMPNITLLAPKNKWEFYDMFRFAVDYNGPIAIRYPRGEAFSGLEEFREPIILGKSEMIYEEKEIALFAYGNMVKEALYVRALLKEEGYNVTLVNARFAKPFDEEMVRYLAKDHDYLVVMEEGTVRGGMCELIQGFVVDHSLPIHVVKCGVADEFVEHGSTEQLFRVAEIDADGIIAKIQLAMDTANKFWE